MKSKKYLLAVLGSAAMCMPLCGCSDDSPIDEADPEISRSISMSDKDRQLSQGVTKLGVNMLKSASTHLSSSENIVVSPLSATMLATLLVNGMEQDEAEATMRAMDLTGSDIAPLNLFLGRMMDEMPEVDTRNKLRMANSVWHQPSLAPHKEFADVAINSLKSEFYTLRKDDAGNQNSVNAWCKEKTGGNIINGPYVAGHDMVVINALHFEGKWADPFNPADTRKEPFTCADGSVREVRMLRGNRHISYGRTDDATYVGMSYYLGSYEAWIIMPDKPIAEFLKEVDSDSFFATHTSGDTRLVMPKFEVQSTDLDLASYLADAGMDAILQSGFNNICPGGLNRTGTLFTQSATIAVDEAGTVATGMSSFGNLTGFPDANKPEVPEEVRIDRPFIFCVEHPGTRLIVSAAIINKL